MAPRVLVDATAVPADRGGLGRYIDGLLPALAEAGADLGIACQRPDADRLSRLAPAATVLPAPSNISHRPERLAWEQEGLPALAQQIGADVIHCPFYSMPAASPVPVVVTIHDASVFHNPAYYADERAEFYRRATRSSLELATRFLVPSRATRDELVRLFDADPARVDVAYHGIDTTMFRPPTDAERDRVAQRLGLHGMPYVGSLGEMSSRKNIPELIRGWVLAASEMDEPPALVLAGSSTPDPAVVEAVNEVPPGLRLVRPGYLRAGDLPGFMGGATVMAFPSRSEGFGFPTLEAMACGAAVLIARRLSLPEVGGEAAAYTEPDADCIARNLRRLLEDEDRRRSLSEAATARSQLFSWSKSAQIHLETYARAAGVASSSEAGDPSSARPQAG
ncbi:glycosyltransferase family 1 protein [Sporichthya brevicatena]|uniref:Glycosyltransferase family 1 protein n=1 Tax=Sporichthya brevicatena TaxID=171442 RepID=A0ABN1G6J9_9ACTN